MFFFHKQFWAFAWVRVFFPFNLRNLLYIYYYCASFRLIIKSLYFIFIAIECKINKQIKWVNARKKKRNQWKNSTNQNNTPNHAHSCTHRWFSNFDCQCVFLILRFFSLLLLQFYRFCVYVVVIKCLTKKKNFTCPHSFCCHHLNVCVHGACD